MLQGMCMPSFIELAQLGKKLWPGNWSVGRTRSSSRRRRKTNPTCKMRRFQTVIKIEQIGISACGFLQRGPWVKIFSYARFQIAGWSGSTSTRLTKIRHSVTLILATRFSSAPKFFWRGGARFRGRWIYIHTKRLRRKKALPFHWPQKYQYHAKFSPSRFRWASKEIIS